MTDNRQDLPDFEDPPVIETAVGVEFTPVEDWNVPHFGLFWHEIEADYPRFEVQGSIGPAQAVMFELPGQVPIRCWFLNNSGSELLQVQNDRFFYNWRKVNGSGEYPHFKNIKPSFERGWKSFYQFLESRSMSAPSVLQCEVTYVNHIERGKDWENLEELGTILPNWVGASQEQFLPTPAAVAMSVLYAMPEDTGTLTIQLQPGLRNSDGREILQLQLTARARPASSDVQDILSCMSMAQDWVVRGFIDFTPAAMHHRWQRRTRS